ncbi:MAG TPA: GGDEF domain-containing protein [Burkholderiales bacterium]|nr:GGDEF domain-containing protein [Burkholderiales bacterium]
MASLVSVIDKSERIKEVVETCAEDLTTVNTVLKNELGSQQNQPKMKNALLQSEDVANKVQECAGELETMNEALEHEVKEREILEHQLAAVKKQEEASRHAAFHDPLTALPNRVLFNDRLEHGLAQAQRHGWLLAVLFMDLNGFKAINDVHGHEVGDKVLQMVADRLKAMTRDDDTVSRHGGDEFLYLLMELKTAGDASIIAEKIIKAIGQTCEIRKDEECLRFNIDLSIGISFFPLDGITADELINRADRAMYAAKQKKIGFALAGDEQA